MIVTTRRLASLLAVLPLAAILLGGASQPAQAQDSETSSTLVSIADLDLSRAADRAVLAHRIELAARRVCGLYDSAGEWMSASYKTCHDDAVANASGQVDLLVASARTRGRVLADAQRASR
ncbi:UrcA family protein [Lichenicoccus sp.]|uniref:UrcA family protein n=1 Tax=Lichenicoccus sp. TaxID=2781899 RepID=UPI003D14656B